MSKPEHYYFVSYSHPSGFGRCSIMREKPITSIVEIAEIEKTLACKDAIIIGWKEFEQPGNSSGYTGKKYPTLKKVLDYCRASTADQKEFDELGEDYIGTAWAFIENEIRDPQEIENAIDKDEG